LSDLVVKFNDSDGGVAAEFVQRLQNLNATNSERELSVDKFLTKSEESFFNKVRKRKLNDAASIPSPYREPVWGAQGGSMYPSLTCMSFFI
jgi:alpha-1,3-glucan synthase